VASLVIVVSADLVLSCGQTDRQTESQYHTDTAHRLTHATVVGVSKNTIYTATATTTTTTTTTAAAAAAADIKLLCFKFLIRH